MHAGQERGWAVKNISLPQMNGTKLLTHSRMSCFQRCPREHQYRYELGIRPAGETKPLRMGSAIHEGIDARAKGASVDEAICAALAPYAAQIDLDIDHEEEGAIELHVEAETVRALLDGYFTAWHNDWQPATAGTHGITPVECVASELAFMMPIDNPETGKRTNNFIAAGKIDRIVRLADGRLAVKETKTTGDSVDDASDYWLKLRIDHQISRYMLAAKHLGHDVQTVLYDVIHKPGIEPTRIPLFDEEGTKIVLDQNGDRVRTKDGKKWRETGDKELGYVLQTRPETAREYGLRLRADIANRPAFYYARQEIPRLSKDLDEYQVELWQQQQALRESQKHGRWFRNPSACSSMGRCQYLNICHQGFDSDSIPAGFVRVDDIHPELTQGA